MALRMQLRRRVNPQIVIGYFSRLNRWRRCNGLKAYTAMHIGLDGDVVFSHKPRPVPEATRRD